MLQFSACSNRDQSNSSGKISFDYGTEDDSARYYFLKGWEEIMDNGRWTESEKAFRKAMEFDPEWLLGKSLVARITRDTEERQQLYKELDSLKEGTGYYERLLLDVNMMSLQAANNRDLGIVNSKDFQLKRARLAERNFGLFVRKFPQDHYFKAEYIEHLNNNYGPKTALDSLKFLANDEQLNLGFYISYAARLELELGNLSEAQLLFDQLEQSQNPDAINSLLMLKADLYFFQDSLVQARQCVEKVIQSDSNHMIARGMQARIDQMLNN